MNGGRVTSRLQSRKVSSLQDPYSRPSFDYACPTESASSVWLYAHRTIGRYCHHCDPGGPAPAFLVPGQGGRSIDRLQKQPATNRHRPGSLCLGCSKVSIVD